MGTRFEFVVLHENPAHAAGAMERAAEVVRDRHNLWSAFEPSSMVSAINRSAPTLAVRVDHETFELLELCERIWRESEGAFDASVSSIPVARGWNSVTLDALTSSVRTCRLGTKVDLGGIAKGWALDRAAESLVELGITNALLHGGTSSILALGAGPSGEGWRVRIGRDGPVVSLRDRALGVSMQRGCDCPGHITDPRTGQPAIACDAAACIAPSAALADAWSTAALVLGRAPEHGPPDASWFLRPRDGSWEQRWNQEEVCA
jgi:thiamine biosynthesis lipoprotein